MKSIFRLFLLFSVCLIGGSQAQTYVGLGASLAVVDLDTNCPTCEVYDVQKTSIKPTGFIGYRAGNTAIEGGIGYAAYRGHAVVPSRPADVRQEIDARYMYLSAVQFVPTSLGDFFAGGGVARVSARNYEHGLTQYTVNGACCATGQVENKSYTKELAPFFQAGYEWKNLRIGVSFIPDVIRSVWTKQSDLYNISAAYVVRF